MEHAVAKLHKNIHNTLTVPCKRSKMVSFASSIMTNIVTPSSRSRFPVKLICRVAFESSWGACCLLESIAINL